MANEKIAVAQSASYRSGSTATAEKHEGGIRIVGIGYYDDEVVLTAENLQALDFVPVEEAK